MKKMRLSSAFLVSLLFANCEGESIRNITKVFNTEAAIVNTAVLGLSWYVGRVVTERPVFPHKGYKKTVKAKEKTDVSTTVEEQLPAHQSEEQSVSTEPDKTEKKYYFQENLPNFFSHCYLKEALWNSWYQGDIDITKEPNKLKKYSLKTVSFLIKATPYALLSILGVCEALHLMNRGSSAYSRTETAFAISGTISNCATEVVSFAKVWSHIRTYRKRNDKKWIEDRQTDYIQYRSDKRSNEADFDEDVNQFFEKIIINNIDDATEKQPLLKVL